MDTKDLIERIYPPYADEIREAVAVADCHCREAFARLGRQPEETTSLEDCALLYLLIRHFGCRNVFESGTFVGTSAIVMDEAVKKNGGHVLTCDVADNRALPKRIKFVHAPGHQAIKLANKVDFAFFDWTPNLRAIVRLWLKSSRHVILATHDFCFLYTGKGDVTVRRLREFFDRRGHWFLPEGAPYTMPDSMQINKCTAFFVPHRLLAAV